MSDPKRATAFTFALTLIQTSTGGLYTAPPLASGDLTVSLDHGSFAALTTTPTVTPAGSVCVLVALSAAEMDADEVVVLGHDPDGAWDDVFITIRPTLQTVEDLPTAAAVNAQVVDALATDTYAEPAAGTPGSTLSLAAKIGYLFKDWRNKKSQTSTQYTLYDASGASTDQKAAVTYDGTTLERSAVVDGR
jgi:hypothetical protein